MAKQARSALVAIVLLLACMPAGAAEAPAPSAPAAAPEAPARATLRQSCYGGRGARLKPLARQLQQQRAQQALRRQDPEAAVRATRRLLQGGEPELPLVPWLIKALEGRGLPEDREAASACAALARDLEDHRPLQTTP